MYRLVYYHLYFQCVSFYGKNCTCKAFSCDTLAKQILIAVIHTKGHFYGETSPIYIFRQLTSSRPTIAVAFLNFNLLFFKICLTKPRNSKNSHLFHEVFLLKTQITKD